MSFSSKWALYGIFLIIHVVVMPWSSYIWLFQLSKYGNFCILRPFEPSFENHDQELIRHILLLSNGLTTRVSFFSRNFGFLRPQMELMGSYMSPRILIPSFLTCITSLLSQLLKCLKINYIRSKINYGLYTVKL